MGKVCRMISSAPPPENKGGGVGDMLKSDEISAIRSLWEKGWRIKRIARELGHGKNTIRKLVRAFEQGLEAPKPSTVKPGRPKGLRNVPVEWLQGQLAQHSGNADVIRQQLISEFGLAVSLRTVERAVSSFRQEDKAASLATVRFETPPGKQIQVDFGTKTVVIGGNKVRVKLCVLTLGYSRRIFVRATMSETQADWFAAIEAAFMHFGGVTKEILVDNAKALVDHNDGAGNVRFNRGFADFCEYWGLKPKACQPYRARTKGKDERAVQYAKRNALAGHEFGSWSEMEAHLVQWTRDVADKRIHKTTREAPIDRFAVEKMALLSIGHQKPYAGPTSWIRTVKTDSTVDVQGNSYSVPVKYIGKVADAKLVDGQMIIAIQSQVIARHKAVEHGRGCRVIDDNHIRKLLSRRPTGDPIFDNVTPSPSVVGGSELLRPLSEYEELFSIAYQNNHIRGAS